MMDTHLTNHINTIDFQTDKKGRRMRFVNLAHRGAVKEV